MKKCFLDKNIYLNIAKSEKFKRINISFKFKDTKDSICEKNIAMEIINNYINSGEIQKKLIRYYGIKVGATTSIRHEYIDEIISLEAIAPIFVSDEQYNLEKIISLIPSILNDLIQTESKKFQQLINNAVDSLLNKAMCKEKISVYNIASKLVFAMEDNEFNTLNRYGKSDNYRNKYNDYEIKEILKKIMYKNQLNVYISGDVEEEIVDYFVENLERNGEIENNEIIEYTNEVNSSLAIGFSVNNVEESKDYICIKILEMLLGGPNGRLFKVLREEKKLVYYITCQYNLLNKVLFVLLSLRKGLKTEIEKIIKYEINNIKNGQICDEEFEISKRLYKEMLMNSLDTPKGVFVMEEMANFHGNQEGDFFRSIDSIRKEQIIEKANNLHYSGSYFLEGSN